MLQSVRSEGIAGNDVINYISIFNELEDLDVNTRSRTCLSTGINNTKKQLQNCIWSVLILYALSKNCDTWADWR